MPEFGKRSRAILNTVDPRLVECCEAVVVHFDITAISGFRGKEEQNELVAQGRSKTEWPHSKHNRNRHGQLQEPCIAVDIAPWPIDWSDTNAFVYMAGLIIQAGIDRGYKIRWGGNWDMDDEVIKDQTFQDLGHFELIE